MDIKMHGLSIGLERFESNVILTIRAVGRLTHDDYLRLTPFLESAITAVDEPKVKVLFDATDFDGWELRAAWDDFRLGLRYGSDFEKIAIYGNSSWQELASKIGSWFIKGEVKSFHHLEQALAWLDES